MFAKLHRNALAASLALLFAANAASAADIQPAVDMGPVAAGQAASVTLVFKLRNPDQLANYIKQTVTPGNPNFQHFLTTAQFASTYGATSQQIAQVQTYLSGHGLQGEVMANHMAIRVQGTLDQLGVLFGTHVDAFQVTATGQQFHRPAARPVLPSALSSVLAVTGLSNEHAFLSHRVHAPTTLTQPAPAPQMHTLSVAASTGNPTATGEPGNYTVGDVANMYDINPLYNRGITGQGSTVAIVTLSDFDPADAQSYWDGIGLTTKANRITKIAIDGGAVMDGGSGETCLDVEQSGGLAPDADVVVYHAPNAGNGFVDAFLQAVIDNTADSISTSWGSPELFNFASVNSGGTGPGDTTDEGDLQIFHEIFMEAAAQGQSVFAAAGDSGAYDTVRGLGFGTDPGTFNAPLTVDSPASDPYITAAGGTTSPFSYSFLADPSDPSSAGPTASVPRERVWGWDYIQSYFATNFKENLNLFSTGGGGGVSVYWPTPFYQAATTGVHRSETGQALIYNDPTNGPYTYATLPSRFAGRNVPDVSLDADPESGFLVISTQDGGVVQGEGGTSFVAPQLNGISALLTQSAGHRIGFWNPQLYFLQKVFGYGRYAAFNAVRDGDNWFYQGSPHYAPGAGIGTLDVANLDLFLRKGL